MPRHPRTFFPRPRACHETLPTLGLRVPRLWKPLVRGGLCLFLLWLAMSGSNPAVSAEEEQVDQIVALLELVIDADTDSARECLSVLSEKVQSGALSGRRLEQLRPRLEELLRPVLQGSSRHPLYLEAHVLAAGWGHVPSLVLMRSTFSDPSREEAARRRALQTLVAAQDKQLLPAVDRLLRGPSRNSTALRAAALAELGNLKQAEVAAVVLKHYPGLEPELQPKAVELLTQRPDWSKQLLQAIGRGTVSRDALHHNQVARLLASRDKQLVELVRRQWGTVRTERDPQREQLIARMQELLTSSHGDPHRGRKVFQRVCGQCHQMYGEGQQVGPDITSNGRSSFEQLLSNVFDPSLVIGSAYQARTVITVDGRVLTGLVVEDNPQQIVLKLQGGKQESIPREEVEETATSRLSLMPEGLENQLKPQELADLFAFLVLDGPPDDAAVRLIRGAPASLVEGK